MEMKLEMSKVALWLPNESNSVWDFTQASSFEKRQPKTPVFSAFFLWPNRDFLSAFQKADSEIMPDAVFATSWEK